MWLEVGQAMAWPSARAVPSRYSSPVPSIVSTISQSSCGISRCELSVRTPGQRILHRGPGPGHEGMGEQRVVDRRQQRADRVLQQFHRHGRGRAGAGAALAVGDRHRHGRAGGYWPGLVRLMAVISPPAGAPIATVGGVV